MWCSTTFTPRPILRSQRFELLACLSREGFRERVCWTWNPSKDSESEPWPPQRRRGQHSEFQPRRAGGWADSEIILPIFLELPGLPRVSARVNPAERLANIARASLFFVLFRARFAEASKDRAGIRAP